MKNKQSKYETRLKFLIRKGTLFQLKGEKDFYIVLSDITIEKDNDRVDHEYWNTFNMRNELMSPSYFWHNCEILYKPL